MNMDLINQIKELNQTIKQLESMPYRSDQDEAKLKDSKHELNELIDKVDNQKDMRRLDDIIQTSKKEKKTIDKTAQDFIENEDQEKPEDDLHLSKIDLKNLRVKKEHLKRLIQKEKEKDDIIKLEEKLDEYLKEGQYITGKRKKDGTYDIREKKYQARLKELQDKRSKAKTRSEKLNISMGILGHKLIKVQKYFNNGMIKTSKGIATVSKQVNELGDELGGMAKYSGFEGNYNHKDTLSAPKNKKSSSKKGKKHKSRKKSGKNQSDQDDFGLGGDFGFNTRNILSG